MNCTLKTIITSPEFSLVIAARLLVKMRPRMIAEGLKAFPVVTLIGQPGCGKTEIIRAISRGQCTANELSFYQKKKEIIEALSEQTDELSYIDDFANLTTDTGRRSQQNMLDTVVRMAHKGEAGMLVLTMETDARKFLATSAESRILFAEIGTGVNDPRISQQLTFLQENFELEALATEFAKFLEQEQPCYAEALAKYRKTAKEIDPSRSERTISMVFAYKFAMLLLNKYFEKSKHDPLDMHAIEAIEAHLYAQKQHSDEHAREMLAERILQRLLRSGDIIAQACGVVDECPVHLSCGCAKRGPDCDYACNEYTGSWKASYSPGHLFVDYDNGANSLMIVDPKMIPNFKRDFYIPPFLIVEADMFLERMNAELVRYCKEEGRSAVYFSGETLRKALRELNRCVVMPNGDRGFRYTLPYFSVNEGEVQKIRVMIILLREEEVAVIPKCHPGYFSQYRYAADSGALLYSIKNEWPKLAFYTGPVGELTPMI